MATVSEVFPKFCGELEDLVRSAGHLELIGQIRDLPIVSRCTCGDFGCAHFYTATPPQGPYSPGHSNVLLAAKLGFIALDVVDGTIVAIEVLDRPDVKQTLDAVLPLPSAS